MKVFWFVAIALAVLGNGLYLLLSDGPEYWVLGLLALPVFVLIISRVPVIFGDDNYPWGPPGT